MQRYKKTTWAVKGTDISEENKWCDCMGAGDVTGEVFIGVAGTYTLHYR